MARVLVYERPVDAVLVDVTFYDNPNRTEGGIKIKEEPLDPEIDTPDDSLSFTSADAVVECKSAAVNGQFSCSLQNEGKKRAPSAERASLKPNKLSIEKEMLLNRKERRRMKNSPASKRNKLYSLRNLNTVDNKRKKVRPEPVECDVCYLTFSQESYMKLHKMSYNSSQRSVEYCCDKCNGTFTTDHTFEAHRKRCIASRCKSVSDRHRFSCYFCERKFRTKARVQSHVFHIHGDLMSGTETYPNTVEATGTIENTCNDDMKVHVPERSKENPSSGTMKKMRQTTLTEFLPLFGKVFLKKQQEMNTNHEQDVAAVENGENERLSLDAFEKIAKDNENCKPVIISTENESVANKRPFVKIHVNSNMMMSLLNTKIKTEPEDSQQNVTSYNACYNLRRRSSVEQDNAYTALAKKRKRTVKYQGTQLWERNAKTKFNCKECIIHLEKYDKSLNREKSKTDEIPSLSGEKDLIEQQVGKSFENNTEKDVESKLASKDVEAALAQVKKLAEVAVNEPIMSSAESNVAKDNNRSNERKLFQCKVCEKPFASKEKMREHIRFFHAAYMSSICNARYTSLNKLLNHYLRQHAVLKRKTCCVCKEKLDTPKILKSHMILHCIRIVLSMKDKMLINNERKCNMSKHHRCSDCGKQFSFKSCLMQHQRVHHRVDVKSGNMIFSKAKQNCDERNDVGSNAVNISRESKSPVKCSPKKCSSWISDAINTPPTEIKLESFVNIISSNRLSGALETKSPQLRKAGNHKRLITGIACVKGYQVDVTVADKTRFPCSICGKQFQTFQNLCIHERTFRKPADNPCTICGTAFSTKRLLQLHLLATHTPSCTENYKYFCRFCNQGFVKKSNVQIHERHFHATQTATNQNPNLARPNIWSMNTVCTVCNLMFESYERFIEHNMYYYKGQVFSCTFCSKSFHGMYMLHHHSKLVHYPDGTRNAYTYTCDTCNEGFNQESHFHAHKLHVHLLETSSVQSPTKSTQDHTNQDHNYALNTHNGVSADASINVPIMTYTCDICNLNFTNARDLSMHELEYSMDGEYQCDKCDRKCRTVFILIKHQSLNHSGCDVNSCYKCRFCGEVSTTNTAMVCHEKHFHANNSQLRSKDNASGQLVASCGAPAENVGQAGKQVGNFTCLTCGMRFEDEVKLKEHLLEYSDIGTFTCDICHRKFAELYRLEAHKIKHSRLNYILSEHHCPICHEGFPTATHVRTHVLHLHGYETFPSIIVKRTNNSDTDTKNPTSGFQMRQMNSDDGLRKLEESNENCKILDTAIHEDKIRDATGSFNVPSKSSLNAEKKSSTCLLTPPSSNSIKPLNVSNRSSVDETQKQRAKCFQCGLVFNSSATLTRHKLRFINCGDHVCKHCDRKFPTRAIFDSHLVKHSIDVQLRFLKYQCSFCEEKFRTLVSLYSHVAHVHGKDKLIEKTSDINGSRVNEIGLKYSKLCGNNTLNILGQVFSTDDLECPQVRITGAEAVDASNLDGERGKSSSIVVSSLNEALTVPKDKKKYRNKSAFYYTCPFCDLKYPTLKRFQTHFKVVHADKVEQTVANTVDFDKRNTKKCLIDNGTCSNQVDLHRRVEKMHVPNSSLDQTASETIDPLQMEDESDAIEIVWEKKVADNNSNKNLQDNDTDQLDIQGIGYHYLAPLAQELEIFPLINTASVTGEVGKLKVKSFAKIIN